MKKGSHFAVVTQVMEAEGQMAADEGSRLAGKSVNLRLTERGSNRDLIC